MNCKVWLAKIEEEGKENTYVIHMPSDIPQEEIKKMISRKYSSSVLLSLDSDPYIIAL